MKLLTRKREYINMHSYSKAQYEIFNGYPVSDPLTQEDKQRLNYLEILQDMNTSMIEHARTLKDGDGLSNENLLWIVRK
jgi:CHASE3 domain sensor protein